MAMTSSQQVVKVLTVVTIVTVVTVVKVVTLVTSIQPAGSDSSDSSESSDISDIHLANRDIIYSKQVVTSTSIRQVDESPIVCTNVMGCSISYFHTVLKIRNMTNIIGFQFQP